jgi:ammonium transporter, Amt family
MSVAQIDCSQYGNNTDTYALCVQTNSLLQTQMKVVAQADYYLQADVNSFFLIWASSLVLWMHAGFAMLSAGALRTKNTKNILISIVMDLTVCAIAWYLCGFAFAYGSDRGGFIGASYFVGIDVGSTATGTTSFYFWLFQYCFAATGATIVSGAVAERARFETYLLYSFWMSFWVYPVVVHWVWGGGFLTLGNPNGKSLMGSGVVDFAG